MDGAVKPAAAGGRRQQPGRPRAGLFPPRPAIAPPTGGQPLRPPRSERYSPRGGATLPRQRRHRPLGAPPTRGRLGAPWRRRADTRGHCGPGAGGGHGKVGLGKAFCHPHPPPRAKNQLHLSAQAGQKWQHSCRARLLQHRCLQIPARTPAHLARQHGCSCRGACGFPLNALSWHLSPYFFCQTRVLLPPPLALGGCSPGANEQFAEV